MAADELGRIDVFSCSPAPVWDHSGGAPRTWPPWASPAPWRAPPSSARAHFDLIVGDALIAVATVLPAMREARDGALLFTTGRSAITPMPIPGNAGIAQVGLRATGPAPRTPDSPPRGSTSATCVSDRRSCPAAATAPPPPSQIAGTHLNRARDTFETTIGF